MRIAYIAAGAGAMYCGACARDAVMARAVNALGHPLHLIPLYTPLKIATEGISFGPIFYGGINVFLEQKSALFRHLPSGLTRLLDHPALLRWASASALEIDPRHLGAMTVSVLAGRDGKQAREVARLLSYLRQDLRPDVVHLTNSLLSGLAPEIKRQMNVPVVCTFQGENLFAADLASPFREQAERLIRDNARSIDRFICPCQAMMPQAARFLDVDPARLCMIRTAVDPLPPSTRPEGKLIIGHLSTIRPAKGLDLLIESLHLLVNQRKLDVVLRVVGRVTDRNFWQHVQEMIAKHSLAKHVEYLGELDGAAKSAFLAGCSVFAFPGRMAEARGVAVLEAMAAGVPVVAPDSGVFPETLSQGGGVLFKPDDPASLAEAIASFADRAVAQRAGDAGRASIIERCSPESMARQMLVEYQKLGL